jgi:hypothetical protein
VSLYLLTYKNKTFIRLAEATQAMFSWEERDLPTTSSHSQTKRRQSKTINIFYFIDSTIHKKEIHFKKTTQTT